MNEAYKVSYISSNFFCEGYGFLIKWFLIKNECIVSNLSTCVLVSVISRRDRLRDHHRFPTCDHDDVFEEKYHDNNNHDNDDGEEDDMNACAKIFACRSFRKASQTSNEPWTVYDKVEKSPFITNGGTNGGTNGEVHVGNGSCDIRRKMSFEEDDTVAPLSPSCEKCAGCRDIFDVSTQTDNDVGNGVKDVALDRCDVDSWQNDAPCEKNDVVFGTRDLTQEKCEIGTIINEASPTENVLDSEHFNVTIEKENVTSETNEHVTDVCGVTSEQHSDNVTNNETRNTANDETNDTANDETNKNVNDETNIDENITEPSVLNETLIEDVPTITSPRLIETRDSTSQTDDEFLGPSLSHIQKQQQQTDKSCGTDTLPQPEEENPQLIESQLSTSSTRSTDSIAKTNRLRKNWNIIVASTHASIAARSMTLEKMFGDVSQAIVIIKQFSPTVYASFRYALLHPASVIRSI